MDPSSSIVEADESGTEAISSIPLHFVHIIHFLPVEANALALPGVGADLKILVLEGNHP